MLRIAESNPTSPRRGEVKSARGPLDPTKPHQTLVATPPVFPDGLSARRLDLFLRRRLLGDALFAFGSGSLRRRRFRRRACRDRNGLAHGPGLSLSGTASPEAGGLSGVAAGSPDQFASVQLGEHGSINFGLAILTARQAPVDSTARHTNTQGIRKRAIWLSKSVKFPRSLRYRQQICKPTLRPARLGRRPDRRARVARISQRAADRRDAGVAPS